MHRFRVRVVEGALDANDTIARANRADFDRAGVAVVNLMSAPGAGKTTLLERTLGDMGYLRVGVLEGDVQGSFDADRLARPEHLRVLERLVLPLRHGSDHGARILADAELRGAHQVADVLDHKEVDLVERDFGKGGPHHVRVEVALAAEARPSRRTISSSVGAT